MKHEGRHQFDSARRAPPASVHIDLDGGVEIFEGHGWRYASGRDPIFDTGLRGFLSFLAEHRIRATLFVVARSLHNPEKRGLIEAAVEQGHEIASHSLTHRYLTSLDTAGKHEEIGASRRLLEQELGITVRGFRAPGYRIDYESLEILAAHGYEYDSSAFPTARYATALHSTVERLRAPHHPVAGQALVEWPMPDHRPFPLPFNPSYALLLGGWLFRAGLDRFRRTGRPLTLLYHLIDLAAPLPAGELPGVAARVFTLSMMSAERKRARCGAMLDRVRQQYRLMTTLEAVEEWRAAEPHRPALQPAGSGHA
ncbi:MAG: polysaccharide deacetylase family protein [Gemmatimonadota bacterium]|nr:polysaccharide deacetylase family protein [Gemmatimonadota bacterium]